MEQNKKENKREKRFSKRAKLFLANGIFFVVLLVIVYCHLNMNPAFVYVSMLGYVMALCIFVVFSLIVYYLSIIADAMKQRYLKSVEKEHEASEQKGK